MDEKRLSEIEARALKASLEPLVKVRDDHGGGRLWKTSSRAP